MAQSQVVTVAPTEEPVTLAEVKRNARVDHADDDALFERWRVAARELAEDHTNRAFCSQTRKLILDRFPPFDDPAGERCDVPYSLLGTAIRLPGGTVQSVSSVKYYDTSGTLTTLTAGTHYLTQLSHLPPLVYPYPGTTWPITQGGRLGAVEVVYVAGHSSAANVPKQVGQAILLTVAYWSENRGSEEDAEKLGLPPGAIRLLDQLRVGVY